MSERSSGGAGRRRKKFLTVEQKYELWTAMVRGDATQRQLGIEANPVGAQAHEVERRARSGRPGVHPGPPDGVPAHPRGNPR